LKKSLRAIERAFGDLERLFTELTRGARRAERRNGRWAGMLGNSQWLDDRRRSFLAIETTDGERSVYRKPGTGT